MTTPAHLPASEIKRRVKAVLDAARAAGQEKDIVVMPDGTIRTVDKAPPVENAERSEQWL